MMTRHNQWNYSCSEALESPESKGGHRLASLKCGLLGHRQASLLAGLGPDRQDLSTKAATYRESI